MIGSIADFNIQIGSGIYRMTDLYGKTLYANKNISAYKSYRSTQPIATFKYGDVIGVIRGYVANGYKGARQPYLIMGETKSTFVVPYAPANFSENALTNQGVKKAKEVEEKKVRDEQPWFIKIIETAAPWVAIGLIGYQLLKKKL